MKAFLEGVAEQVLFLDPPRHTQVRKLLNRAFTPEAIARNRPRISGLFDQLLHDWIRSGECEIMATLVHPFPALVIPTGWDSHAIAGRASWCGRMPRYG